MNIKQACGALLALILLLPCAQALAAPAAAQKQEGKTYQVVLLRHGQSNMNVANEYSGWSDAYLTEAGIAGGLKAGELMKKEGLAFDAVYTSFLKRAIQTAWLALQGLDMMWVPVHTDWRLNESNYGAFEGKSPEGMRAIWSEEQIKKWQASYDISPPPLSINDPKSPVNDARYSHVPKFQLADSESLEATFARVNAYWQHVIIPAMKSGQTRIMVVSHSNALRALSMSIDPEINKDTVTKLRIANTTPIIYTLDADMKPISRRMLEPPK